MYVYIFCIWYKHVYKNNMWEKVVEEIDLLYGETWSRHRSKSDEPMTRAIISRRPSGRLYQ